MSLPPVPSYDADPAAVRDCAAVLLAASAQVDDLGSFAAGSAQVAGWTGLAADAYHAASRPTGRRGDAVSLALRHVARRVDAHADALESLRVRRDVLLDERARLAAELADVPTATATGATAAVRRFAADVAGWSADLAAEEAGMRAVLTRFDRLDGALRRFGDAADPADAALSRLPGHGAPPGVVKAWWDGLDAAQRRAVVAAAPGAVGNLDGIPARWRDAANRVALDRDLAAWELLADLGRLGDDEARWLVNARAAHEAVATAQAGVDPVTLQPVPAQLHLYDPRAFDGDGAVAVAVGDLDVADDVAVVVPGLGSDAGSAPYQAARAVTLYESCRVLDASATPAVLAWVGYDAPDNVPWDGGPDAGWDGAGVVREDHAARGGERLADAVDGLRAGRDGEPAHVTVVGHSYGSTTAGHAAHDHGLPVDDLVLVGSPGAGGDTDHAADTGLDPSHVWAVANSRDAVADLANHGAFHLESLAGGGLGDDPAEDDFGARRVRAESTDRAALPGLADHARYFDHDTEALRNISLVVTGDHDAVTLAGPVTDPWWGPPHDPEWHRPPEAPDTDGRP
ncbi:alpha/beta hydrolase [Nocardioides sp. GCM10027113]|uniref:alpha/beta hydrolase n=1 Tax=unclassified Nocardioides TaxID=2615069 RepID=UPI003619F308